MTLFGNERHLMNIEYVSGGSLREAPWRSTYVLKPDQRLLSASLLAYGWVSPLLVQVGGTIIDGHERWKIAASNSEIVQRDSGLIPVIWADCDEVEAMIMHVRVNRAKGIMHAKSLSNLIRRILRSKAYDEAELKTLFGMSKEEMELLSAGSFLKKKKVAEHQYSKAWVPVEAAAGAVAPSVSIERPPNADR
jgi:hypothetical protein